MHALPGMCTLNIFEYEISLSCGKFRNYHREPSFGHGNTFDRGRPVAATADCHDHLLWVMLGIRAAFQEDRDFSPAEAIFGTHLTLPDQFVDTAAIS